MKKVADKIDHTSKLRTHIPAGMAAAGPPLGPMLGQVQILKRTIKWYLYGHFLKFTHKCNVMLQRNINIAAFCKDFNERTANIKPGIPLPTRVKVNPDRSYQLTIHQPPASYFLMQAAGVNKGAMNSGEWSLSDVSLGLHNTRGVSFSSQ